MSLSAVMRVNYRLVNSEVTEVGPDSCNLAKYVQGRTHQDVQDAFPGCVIFVWFGDLWIPLDEAPAASMVDNARLRIIQAVRGEEAKVKVVLRDPKRSSKKREEHLIFHAWPTFDSIKQSVEELFEEYRVEDYLLRFGKTRVYVGSWPTLTSGRKQLTIVVSRISRPFPSLDPSEGYDILGVRDRMLTREQNPSPSQNPESEWDADKELDSSVQAATGFRTCADVPHYMGVSLALRCMQRDPTEIIRESSRRELISPLLFAAATLAGEIDVHSDFVARGSRTYGEIDWVLNFKGFSMVVIEGKLHDTLTEHVGHLCGAMESTREQYAQERHGKRKHANVEELKEVPSFGVLSNGYKYIFYKYDPKDQSLVSTRVMRVELELRTPAETAVAHAVPVVLVMLELIKAQKAALVQYERKKLRIESRRRRSGQLK